MNNLNSTKKQLPINLLLSGVVLATIVTGGLGWFTFKSFDKLTALQIRNQEVSELQGKITHFDEVLTMSARMAAATGDAKWENRYRQFEPSLDDTIKKLISLQPKEVKAADETNEANKKLVEMENQAFLLVQQNRQADASQVLFSSEYEQQKKIYATGTLNFYENTKKTLNHELKIHRENVSVLRSSLIAFLAVSFFGWIMVLLKVRKWNTELSLINEHLDNRVKEQTALLVNTSKMSALGEMAGGVAHEINTPLAIIGMRVEQMEECVNDGDFDAIDFVEAISVIKSTVTRIAAIVGGLRFFAREGKLAETQTISISKLTEETISFCSERFSNHGVQLDIVKNEIYATTQIECRTVEMSQVLLNLLNNAFDAVEGLKEKWIRLEFSESGQFVDISVTDSGHGIPKDIQEKIMQPFFTTKEIGKGTGLGLSISNGIIMSHQGKIYIDNNCPNTKFTVVIPKTQAKLKSTLQEAT
ncbi:MAG: ATP-binding protein [Bdellovibrionota bacterium]